MWLPLFLDIGYKLAVDTDILMNDQGDHQVALCSHTPPLPIGIQNVLELQGSPMLDRECCCLAEKFTTFLKLIYIFTYCILVSLFFLN